MGQAPSTPNSSSPKRRFASLGRSSTFASQYMPGDDMVAPSTPERERPSSPEPQRQVSHPMVKPDEVPRTEEVTDAEPDRLLHTTFPYSHDKDSMDREDTMLSQTSSLPDHPSSDSEVKIIDSVAHVPHHEPPFSAEILPTPSLDHVDETKNALESQEETRLQMARDDVLLPEHDQIHEHLVDPGPGVVAEPVISPKEGSIHLPHGDVHHEVDLSGSSGTAVNADEVETVSEHLSGSFHTMPETISQEHDSPRVQQSEALKEVFASEEHIPDDIQLLHGGALHDKLELQPDAHLPAGPESPSTSDHDAESSSDSQSSESSNDDRTLDLVLHDREAWDRNEAKSALDPAAPPRRFGIRAPISLPMHEVRPHSTYLRAIEDP